MKSAFLKTALFCLAALVFVPNVGSASSAAVVPAVLDKKAFPRDILKESLVLTNPTGQMLTLYAFVNNISVNEGKQEFLDPSKADHSSSLANWISISRGVINLAPQESVTLDYRIEVNLKAQPGNYHAVISFADGPTRDEAEKKLAGSPMLLVNLEVLEDIKEQAQLKGFYPEKGFNLGLPAAFTYQVENIGNRSLVVQGEVIIYNRRGKEVASLPVNQERQAVEPGQTASFSSSWEYFKALGKYKAVLNADYGVRQRGALQDTVYFWVVPKEAILLAGLVLASLFFLAWVFGRISSRQRQQAALNSQPRGSPEAGSFINSSLGGTGAPLRPVTAKNTAMRLAGRAVRGSGIVKPPLKGQFKSPAPKASSASPRPAGGRPKLSGQKPRPGPKLGGRVV